MFSIELEDVIAENIEFDEPMVWGKIVLDSFEEDFLSPLVYWSPADYRSHWIRSLEYLLSNHLPSCLITSMYNPARANFIQWWLLYPSEGDNIFVQNQILFFNTLKGVFDPWNPYDHVPGRVTVSEDGDTISEWKVPLVAIALFHKNHLQWLR